MPLKGAKMILKDAIMPPKYALMTKRCKNDPEFEKLTHKDAKITLENAKLALKYAKRRLNDKKKYL